MRCSETERAIICHASLVAPERLVSSAKSKAATEFGTLAHYFKETGITNPEWAKPADVDLLERKVLLSGIDRAKIWPSSGRHEVTFAMNLVTLQVNWFEGCREDADAWKKAHSEGNTEWLTGTSDYEDDSQDWTDDLKTGSWPVIARTCAQLRSYSLPRWVTMGMPMKYNRRVTITQWPKYPIAALPKRNEHWLCGLDLMMHLEALQRARTHTDEYNITEDGCKFCKAKKTYEDLTCEEALI